MKLFVDDIRACPEGWTLARTNTEAIRLLSKAVVTEISLDFDIRTCSNKRCQENRETFEPVYHMLYLMQRTCPSSTPQRIFIHTGNVSEGQKWAKELGRFVPVHCEIFNPENYI